MYLGSESSGIVSRDGSSRRNSGIDILACLSNNADTKEKRGSERGLHGDIWNDTPLKNVVDKGKDTSILILLPLPPSYASFSKLRAEFSPRCGVRPTNTKPALRPDRGAAGQNKPGDHEIGRTGWNSFFGHIAMEHGKGKPCKRRTGVIDPARKRTHSCSRSLTKALSGRG